MGKLYVGQVSPNGQVTIVDEDRLCYLVKNTSRGADGIWTINKILLDEFIDELKKNPSLSAEQARNNLSGKSDIDKFEYGYNSTLLTMAKMAIENESDALDIPSKSLQQIFYGAPGTGKSYSIAEQIGNDDIVRTTFHPDSDYSTFVGAYKPTTKEVPVRDASGKVIEENGEPIKESRVTYEFVAQSFLRAYVDAWKKYADSKGGTPENVYLVIEEINRGNCAQIFGDLFQLLDRNDSGFSDYPIKADDDLRRHLKETFDGISISQRASINSLYRGKDVIQDVLEGKSLLLPNNLFIWASMNTSDQSLFPIDSAFKRRWDWKYMPISNARKGWRIVLGKDEQYDWWDFVEKINSVIGSTTNSEDKKLGYFFCKPHNGEIYPEKFVSKVVFYLWNDVFKDFEFSDPIFNDTDGEKLYFDKFYTKNGLNSTVDRKKISIFLNNLGLTSFSAPSGGEDESLAEETSKGEGNGGRLRVVYPDGTVIEHKKSVDTFVEVINYAGPEQVAALGLKVSKYPMVSKTKLDSNEGGYQQTQKELSDGSWLITKLSNPDKLNRLQYISKQLDLNLDISIV